MKGRILLAVRRYVCCFLKHVYGLHLPPLPPGTRKATMSVRTAFPADEPEVQVRERETESIERGVSVVVCSCRQVSSEICRRSNPGGRRVSATLVQVSMDAGKQLTGRVQKCPEIEERERCRLYLVYYRGVDRLLVYYLVECAPVR